MDEKLAELLRRLYGLANYNNLRSAGEVASMTPTPIGDVASGMLAVDDLRKGDYLGAAGNAVGVLPFVPAIGGIVKRGATPELLNSLYKPDAIKKSLYNPSDFHVTMQPDDFLKLATPIVEGRDTRKRINDLKKVKKFDDVPYLEVIIRKDGKPVVVDHEGRHRATALKERGVTEMGVVLAQSPEFRKQFPRMSSDDFAKLFSKSGEITGELGGANVVKFAGE